MSAENRLTERQEKWFASVRASLERETGRSLADWVEIAKACPETGHRARLKWFKETHGLLQNCASLVLESAFPAAAGRDAPAELRAALWADPASRAILGAVERAVAGLPDVVAGQRKGYSAWSRKLQFAALRPAPKGTAVLGLALVPEADPRLRPPRNKGWSERLRSCLALASPGAVDGSVEALLRQAWAAS